MSCVWICICVCIYIYTHLSISLLQGGCHKYEKEETPDFVNPRSPSVFATTRGPFGVPCSKDYVADGQGWDGGF